MVMARQLSLSQSDHVRVSAAVHAAEQGTAGEIVTITADASDSYNDIALWWAIGTAVIAVATLAAFPGFYANLLGLMTNGWGTDLTVAVALEMALALLVLIFAIVRLSLNYRPLRFALVPRVIRAQRVRTRALALFRVGAEARTTGRTGILIYVSLSEHIAEIIADEAIHSKVAPGVWGDAMADLIAEVREGRLADGMIAAVRDVGVILAEHFPRADDDTNELPDRLIEL
jgi:putative membrane protein